MSVAETSRTALQSMEPHLDRLELLVISTIIKHGPMTCDRCEEITGLAHQTISARFNALAKPTRKLIEDSGEKRKTRSGRPAVVWRIPQKPQVEEQQSFI